jgi:hypothetical protein
VQIEITLVAASCEAEGPSAKPAKHLLVQSKVHAKLRLRGSTGASKVTERLVACGATIVGVTEDGLRRNGWMQWAGGKCIVLHCTVDTNGKARFLLLRLFDPGSTTRPVQDTGTRILKNLGNVKVIAHHAG